MKTYTKFLVIGLLILFAGASVGASIVPNINEEKNINIENRNIINSTQIRGEWSDNFDSYEAGTALDGQGGWESWDNVPTATGYVSDDQSRSSPNSLQLEWFEPSLGADMVHQFTGVNSGKWRITAWQYLPSTQTGRAYFILLNTYVSGSGADSWSTQLYFSASEGYAVDYDDTTKKVPIVTDEWVQIRVDIDFVADQQVIYYNNEILNTKSWTDGASGGGALNLACVDLWAGDTSAPSTTFYYDDLVLAEVLPLSCDANGPYNGKIDEEIQFEGSVLGGLEPYEYLWDFGDGNTATDEDPVHTYTKAGTYTVTLTVKDYEQTEVSDETTATIIGVPALDVIDVYGGMLKVGAKIKNIGSADASNVQWSISLSGGLILLGKESSGTISIPAGQTVTIQSNPIIGLGKTAITVKADIPESSDTMTKDGFVLLIYIKA